MRFTWTLQKQQMFSMKSKNPKCLTASSIRFGKLRKLSSLDFLSCTSILISKRHTSNNTCITLKRTQTVLLKITLFLIV